MQDFRPPSWSVLRRHPDSLIENGQVGRVLDLQQKAPRSGQAMLEEQEALNERRGCLVPECRNMSRTPPIPSSRSEKNHEV